jgi:glucosamine--fructose-6-phosphate aminotransferase (isomerizing)
MPDRKSAWPPTKAFTSQITVLSLIALLIGRLRVMSKREGQEQIEHLQKLPEQVQRILDKDKQILEIAEAYKVTPISCTSAAARTSRSASRAPSSSRRISYIHAEGYPAAEMKHGPIALIDKNMPVVVICPKDNAYQKILGNIAEVKARKGRIIVICNEGDHEVAEMADHVITIPQTLDFLYPTWP